MAMASLKPDFFAWEMFYKTIEKAVMRKTDILIALVHFVLLKHARFLCLGNGEEQILAPCEVGNELLPDGWNYDSDKYALRYIWGYVIFLLSGCTSEEGFVITLLNVQTEKDSKIILDAEKLVSKIKGSITDLVPDATQLAERIRRELIDPVRPRLTQEMTTQTTPNDSQKPENSDNGITSLRDFISLRIGDTRPLCFKCNVQPNPNL